MRMWACAVKEGRGQSTVTMTPAAACAAIREGAAKALRGELKKSLLAMPEHFIVEIAYADPVLAARHQWYPGMQHAGNRTIRFETSHYFDVLRMLNYVT
jgi:D-amino peptidase